MSQISEAVLALDLTAVDMARTQGAAAIPELRQFLSHDDATVRVVATTALGEIPHADAYQALLQAAQDADDSVAVTAVDQLIKHKSAMGAAALLRALESIKSLPAQRQLVLAIGTIATPQDAESLNSYCAYNQDADIALACLAALSRLGSAKAQKDFTRYFVNTRDLEAFELAEYISQPWLLAPLSQLLGFTDPLQNLGDPPPGFPNMLRICDKAVVLIARISKAPFSFRTDVHMNYTNDQLAEAARVAARSAGN